MDIIPKGDDCCGFRGSSGYGHVDPGPTFNEGTSINGLTTSFDPKDRSWTHYVPQA